MRMLMLRRRKMRMLRRKTDPKPGKSLRRRKAHGHFTRAILCGNLQGKCRTLIPRPAFCARLRCRNAHGHLTRSILCENLQGKCQTFCAKIRAHANPAANILCEPALSKCTRTCHKRHFVRKFTGKMPDADPTESTLCKPAQSKCTWTCHKRHFVRKFTGKMPDASDTTSIEHRPLTVTVRTFQCGHTVWRNTHTYTYA